MKILNDTNFEETIKSGYTVVDFYADWCQPCLQFSSTFEEMAEMHPDAKFYKLNIDEARQVTEKCNVMSIPTIIIFHNGKEITRVVGAPNRISFKLMLSENLKTEQIAQ